jgi:hypothetical protein
MQVFRFFPTKNLCFSLRLRASALKLIFWIFMTPTRASLE